MVLIANKWEAIIMFNLIVRPNKRIDKDLLLKSIKYSNDYLKKPVLLRILEVGESSNMFDDHIIYINVEIRQHVFKCKAYKCDNGKLDKSKLETVNASNEVVTLLYNVEWSAINNMTIEKYHDLWPLLNYAFEKKNMVQRGNHQGFKDIKISALKNALNNLEFKACTGANDDGTLFLEPYIKEFTKQK